MFLLPDSMFTVGNPLRDLLRGTSPWWGFTGVFLGPIRRTRESIRIRVDDPREAMFKTLQSLGRVAPCSAAETVSPWKRFDKALAQLVKDEGWKRGRRMPVTLCLPVLSRAVRRKVLERTDRYWGVCVRFNQSRW